MPWNRARGDQNDRHRRKSTVLLDPAEAPSLGHDHKKSQPEPQTVSGISTSASDLLDHGHDLQLSVSQGQDPYPHRREPQTVRPQRFSLLRFRHASDSQLSRTARDQTMTRPPPVPDGK